MPISAENLSDYPEKPPDVSDASDVPVWQERDAIQEQPGNVASMVDNFNQMADIHVQSMFGKLIMEHQSSVRSLQSEIRSLQRQLRDAQNTPTQVAPASEGAQVSIEEPKASADREALNSSSGTVSHIPETTVSNEKVASARTRTSLDMLNEPHTQPEATDNPKPSTADQGVTYVQGLVMSNAFEILTSGVIVANTIIIAMQLQYHGFDMGYSLRPLTYTEPAHAVWPGADTVFSIFDMIFNAAFCLELLLRLYAFRLKSVCMPWIWFDSIIVLLGLGDTAFGSSGLGIDPTMIRLVRLVRIVRMFKIFRSMVAFDSLFLLIKSIYASVGALCWSFLLLFVVQIAVACFFCQILQGFVDAESNDEEARDRVFTYFGTFARSMLTLFEITFANWVPSCRILFEDVNQFLAIVYLLYRCVFIFAVMKVIAAVFIAETNRVLADDVEMTVMKSAREKAGFRRRATAVLTTIDVDHDGKITESEMKKFLVDPGMTAWLASLGVEKNDFEKLFWLVESDGYVSTDRFLSMVGQLKGNAKTVDLLNLFKFLHRMDHQLQIALKIDQDYEQEKIAKLAEGEDQ